MKRLILNPDFPFNEGDWVFRAYSSNNGKTTCIAEVFGWVRVGKVYQVIVDDCGYLSIKDGSFEDGLFDSKPARGNYDHQYFLPYTNLHRILYGV